MSETIIICKICNYEVEYKPGIKQIAWAYHIRKMKDDPEHAKYLERAEAIIAQSNKDAREKTKQVKDKDCQDYYSS